MKKLFLGLIVMMAILSLSVHGFPPPLCSRIYADDFLFPFNEGKKIAMQSPPNQDGQSIWPRKINIDSETVEYRIIFGDNGNGHEYVIFAKITKDEIFVIGHCKGCQNFKKISPDGMRWIEIDREEAIKRASEILKELKTNKLIK